MIIEFPLGICHMVAVIKNLENIVLLSLFGLLDTYFLNDLLSIHELLVLYIYT